MFDDTCSMMRTQLTALFCTLLSLSMSAQLLINGHSVAFDEQNHVWLATVPETLFEHDSTLAIGFSGDYKSLVIDGATVSNSYCFKNITANSMYPAMVRTQEGQTIAGIIMFTCLPVIQLAGDFDDDYHDGKIVVNDPEADSTFVSDVKAKWRGGTTNGPEKHKRNYKIAFPDDCQFFGLRRDNHWILDAGQADPFRLRNRIATDLWNDFATKPYYARREPKVLTGARGRVVEVFLNGEYWGIYNFSECLDRKQLKVMKVNPTTHEVHGAVWKAKGYGMAMMNWNSTPVPDARSEWWDTFKVVYPDLEDNDTTDWYTLSEAIRFVSRSHTTDFRNRVGEYFDLPPIIDYFLFINLLLAPDNTAKNIVWAVYDKQTDRRLTPAVWDLDATVGQPWLKDINFSFTSPYFGIMYGNRLMERLYQLNVDSIIQKTVERYQQLRKTHFTAYHLISRYQKYYDLLVKSGAARRETDRWNGDSDLNGHEINFDADIAAITTWLTRRLGSLDKQITESYIIKSDVDAVPFPDQQYISNAIYSLTGQKIESATPHKMLKSGIYISNRKKYMIK